MAKRVWLYPDRVFEELGAKRFLLRWEEVKPTANMDDIDPDVDVAYRSKAFKSKSAALAAGRKVVDSGRTAYGVARVAEQVVGWFVEEDRVAEWQNVGEEEHVD